MDLKLFDELRINQHNTHNYFKSSLRDNKKQVLRYIIIAKIQGGPDSRI
jgi:hypothetical protein